MPPIVHISDPADARIAAFRDVRERDLVGRAGQFIAEGEVVLRVLVNGARHEALALLLAEKRVAKLEPLLSRLPEDVPVYAAPQEILDTIAGFHLHRGILALGRCAPDAGAAALLAGLPEKALVLVLVGIANHDNMGGLFRNAAAFGADAVLLDAESCDPLYRKSIRVSAGAALTVPFARFSRDDDIVAVLERSGFSALALSPSGAHALSEIAPPPRAALLFGAEGSGLPDIFLRRVRTVRIPMAAGFDSLNVATSSGIVLHHFAVARL
jgi:tRNA G18 (ribose-2'-O)-methylase SpoU